MDIRYVAGLFDGEGMVSIIKWVKPESTHTRYQVRISIGMTHWPVIEALKARFYGRGSLHQNRHDLRNPAHRIQFTWIAVSQDAAMCLREMLPYLIVKRDEAELALELQEHIDANRPTLATRDDIIAHRDDLFQRITALKKRSYPPLTT
jgi:hypothetical protein